MPAQSNIDMLEKVKGSIEASKGVFVVDYRGLTVKEAQELRRALREANAHMKVYKNNIVRIALNEAEMPNIDDMLKGTCAYVFYEKDPVEAAKVLKQEADKLKKMQILGGIADGKAISAEEALAYAELPSRDELLAKLVYVIGSPLSGIAQVCAGPARGLVTALQAVADKQAA
ncbi:50S ribosomal protein L10 [Olsenella sp. AM30-3LB]|jgi:large subunit ribosomal protein L10|uniref:Large ribosomal subunit protein uL10 n=1 Tax=Tractidigestivibacter montrealensis TaxID=2972466 RepID=A0ABT1Z6C2_9ACTN|nr:MULTISPECIES: 50S ribosomal protein L10 [Atopobiaceae]MCR9035768.1 50S ribosomal protein L10 [Tractidigestivibacter montrealensis]RGJ45999.1 50S ribosomal protein L10 [Olsenella sp. TM06-36]RHB54798.1 50S ribosomal protein L10 [Olsenella sp. AM39-30AC]RHD76954.1 50S ribosomal protein L10 [Olsenella sp. AM30-3LB]RHK04376.1 50S ribosomal protein L10 [Olsenella sp. AM04-33]